jgi:predicted N-acetyltransferase YhbS
MTVTDARVLRELEDNCLDWMAVFARLPGADVHDDPDCAWAVTDIAFPLCNSVMFPRFDDATAEARVDEILAAGRERRVLQMWWTGPSTPAAVTAALEERGVALAERMPGMALALEGWTAPAPAGEIRRVRTPADAEMFGQVLAAGFGMPADVAVAITRAAGELHDDRFVDLLVMEDDRPVASASAIVARGVVGLYDVAVVPNEQRRGLGTAVTVAALEAGRARGARHAILHSGAEGFGAYAKLGFETIGEMATWVTRAPGARR